MNAVRVQTSRIVLRRQPHRFEVTLYVPLAEAPGRELTVSLPAHRQIADHCGIPWRFYLRLLETEQELLGIVVTTLFASEAAWRELVIRDGCLVEFRAPKPQED